MQIWHPCDIILAFKYDQFYLTFFPIIPYQDDDCLDDYLCFQKDMLELVPGCSGLGDVSYDYCVMDPAGTKAPSNVPVGFTQAPAMSPTNFADLVFVVDGVKEPLGICQGDCDNGMDSMLCPILKFHDEMSLTVFCCCYFDFGNQMMIAWMLWFASRGTCWRMCQVVLDKVI